MNQARGLWALLFVLGLAACQPQTQTTMAEYAVFGTTVTVTIRHPSRVSPEGPLAQLDHLFQRLHRDWHPWAPGALTTLNQALSSGDWVTITPDLAELLEQSQTLESMSDGLFNPAIGQLVSLWGFHTSTYPITTPPPSQQAIDQLIQTQPSTSAIEWMNGDDGEVQIRTDNPSIALDFSGIAKGAAAKMACEILYEAKLNEALVNLGGDVMVCGAGTQPWRVAINDPRSGVVEVLEVDEPLAIFTSGQYYRYREWSGERYAHILNPYTGQPIEHVLQATAISADPILADAAATALVVAGADRAKALGEALGLSQWLLIDEQGDLKWSDED